MAMVLQQALRGLCYKSRWSYAVFWKLKRRSKMVLTWEDGFYEFSKVSSVSNFDPMQAASGYPVMNVGGTLESDSLVPEMPSAEDEIGLAVARMSYHVYSLGERIIGRVAFTGKHEWVFGERGSTGEGNVSGRSTGRTLNEKYPAGWQQQFKAGIKTIAVVAVPQGVVQLGSTQTVMEDLSLVSHVRTLFGTLQSIPGAFLSDYVPETQGGAAPCPIGLPVGMMMPVGAANDMVKRTRSAHLHPAQMSMSDNFQGTIPAMGRGSHDMMNLCKPSSLARIQLSNPYLPSPINPLSIRSSRMLCGPHVNKDSTRRNHSLLSTVSMAVGNRQGIMTIPFTNVSAQGSGPGASDVAPTESATLPPLVAGRWNRASSINLVSRTKVGVSYDQMLHADQGSCHQLQPKVPVCEGDAYQGKTLSTKRPLLASTGGRCSASISGNTLVDTKPSKPFRQNGLRSLDSCTTQSLRDSRLESTGFIGLDNTNGIHEQKQVFNGNQGELKSGQNLMPAPSRMIPKLELPSRVHPLKVPDEGFSLSSGNWTHISTYRNTQIGCLDVPGSEIPGDSQLADKRGIVNVGQTMEEKCHSKDNFVHPPRTYSEGPELVNQTGPTSNCSANTQSRQVNSDVRRNDDIQTKMAEKVWNEGLNSDWDCFSALLNPFPIGDELSQALRPASMIEGDTDSYGNVHHHHPAEDIKFNSDAQGVGHAKLMSNLDERKETCPIAMEYDLFNVVPDPEPLLEAMVAGVSSVPSDHSPSVVDSSSQGPNLSGCTSALSGDLDSLLQKNEIYRPEASGEVLEYDTSNRVSSGKVDKQFERLSRCRVDFQRETVYNVASRPMGMSPDEGQKRIDDESGLYESLLPAKRNELGKGGNIRKKPKLGEALRPRPKDRQQIQDRVRELREIVPNACKCSIDALLERTIKHMHFLQSVTEHSGKWKQCGDLNEEDAQLPPEDQRSYTQIEADVKEKLDAVKFGKANSGCPIVVENLSQPRQMLVEMLCEEKGLFLEIADTVRSLGLTILKGSMESSCGKTWARFVVEAASRGVHRVEVLWNLMQLVQPTCTPASNHYRPSDCTEPCMFGGAQDSTASSLTSSFPLMVHHSAPLHMTAR